MVREVHEGKTETSGSDEEEQPKKMPSYQRYEVQYECDHGRSLFHLKPALLILVVNSEFAK